MRAATPNKIEASLRNYLIDEHSSTLRTQSDSSLQKYKGLKVYIELKQSATPYFNVGIGMLEAQFTINDGTKIGGSLGTADDRNVQKWYRRTYFKDDLMGVWNVNYVRDRMVYTPKRHNRDEAETT